MLHKIVLVPDSFKGTLSSARFCALCAQKIAELAPQCTAVSVPVADGGEGSVDCFLTALGGKKIQVHTKNPLLEDMTASYGILAGPGPGTAVIEMAACAGLPLIEGRKDPLRASTYGVGLLLRDALERGCRRIILGLGGSATTDMGLGAAQALGARFYEESGKEFLPVGGNLDKLRHVDLSGMLLPPGTEILCMCDIQNPLYGPMGAAHVFSPQKGATPEQTELLDRGLRSAAAVIKAECGTDVSRIPGGGAAGGMGAGMFALLHAKLQSGIETVLNTVKFDEILRDADLCITGEGLLDRQSTMGKVLDGVSRRTRAQGVPLIALVGGVSYDVGDIYQTGVTAVFTVNRLPEPLEESSLHTEENLLFAMENVLRMYLCADK